MPAVRRLATRVVTVALLVVGVTACSPSQPAPEPPTTTSPAPDPALTVTGTPEIIGTIAAGEILTPDIGTVTFPTGFNIQPDMDGSTYYYTTDGKEPRAGTLVTVAAWGWETDPNFGVQSGELLTGMRFQPSSLMVGGTIQLCLGLNRERNRPERDTGMYFPGGESESCTPKYVVAQAGSTGPREIAPDPTPSVG